MSSSLWKSDPRRRLAELHAATLRRVASLTNSFDEIVEASAGSNTDDEHDPEGHTIAWERQQVAALLEEARARLAEIEAAEQRIDAGSYGTCRVCSLPIAPPRLDALPTTTTCVRCAAAAAT